MTEAADDLLLPQQPGIPVPNPSGLARPYWDGLRQGELRFQRCTSCANPVFNPSVVCSACLGRDLAWETSTGRGTLYSWTVVWRPQTPAFRVPYAPAIVTLDEGWWLVSAVIGCRPADLRADLPLEVELHPAGDDIVLPYFRPYSHPATPVEDGLLARRQGRRGDVALVLPATASGSRSSPP